MSAPFAIAQREFLSYYRSGLGWIVVALFLLLSGAVVGTVCYIPGEEASLRPFFALAHWLMLMVAPAISMRVFAEEIRSRTLEPLMTAPVSDWSIVVAKYAGAVGFLVSMLLPTLAYTLVLELVADPEPGPIISGYLGLLLVGMLYLAVGVAASSLTDSQIVAYLATLFFFLALWFLSEQVSARVGEPFSDILYGLSVSNRASDFAKGVIDTGHVAVFLAASFWFVAFTVVSVEFRRWR